MIWYELFMMFAIYNHHHPPTFISCFSASSQPADQIYFFMLCSCILICLMLSDFNMGINMSTSLLFCFIISAIPISARISVKSLISRWAEIMMRSSQSPKPTWRLRYSNVLMERLGDTVLR